MSFQEKEVMGDCSLKTLHPEPDVEKRAFCRICFDEEVHA